MNKSKRKTKIGVSMMAKNAELFISCTVQCLSWVDGIYLYDDNSSDRTVQRAQDTARVPLVVEEGKERKPIFERGELKIRNYIIERAFEELDCDVLILNDIDELMSRNLKPVILEVFSDQKIDSLCFSIWHLYSRKQYIHFWETYVNGVYLVDPHIRVIRKERRYEPGYSDGSHPFIRATDLTRCVHGPYHYHLKYYYKSPYPNYSLNFLPKYPKRENVRPYLRDLPFPLPADIDRHISIVDWNSMRHTDTDYYKNYESTRVILTANEVLTHPRDLK